MTQQMQNNVDTISPSLEAKLRRFAGELTPAEQAQLRTIQAQPQDVSGLMSSPLWDKAQQAVDALTTEETAEIGLLLERTGVAAPADDAADVEGHRAAAYEEDDGWKGKPGTNPRGVAKGANSLRPVAGFLFIVGSIFPGVVLVEYPEYGQETWRN